MYQVQVSRYDYLRFGKVRVGMLIQVGMLNNFS